MSLIKLTVKTDNQKYPIFIGNNVLHKLPKILKEPEPYPKYYFQ